MCSLICLFTVRVCLTYLNITRFSYVRMVSDLQVAGVDYRNENEFKLNRESQSAYYYGKKYGEDGRVDITDDASVQKRVVLERVRWFLKIST